MLRRLGSALILLGVILMVVYLVSSTADQGQTPALLAGAILSLVGLYFRRVGSSGEPSSARFRSVRRWMGRRPETDDKE